MTTENIRQLLWYFVSDTGITIDEVCEKTDLDENVLVAFLYGGRYLDDTTAEVIYRFLQDQYKLRDAVQMATLGAKLLEEDEDESYTTKGH